MTATKGSVRDGGGTSFAGLPFPAVDPGLFGAAYGEGVLQMQREWLVGMGQIQRDYLTFLGERMRKDIEIARRMAECRDVQAALELQTAFVETAREDYLEEAQKLLAKSREITEHCVDCLTELPQKANGGGHATAGTATRQSAS